jgi:hypothetical protein
MVPLLAGVSICSPGPMLGEPSCNMALAPRRANHALSRRSPVGRAAMRWASQQSGACSRSASHGWKAILPSRSSRGIVPGPPREVIALREFSATGVCLIALLAGSSRLKWDGYVVVATRLSNVTSAYIIV